MSGSVLINAVRCIRFVPFARTSQPRGELRLCASSCGDGPHDGRQASRAGASAPCARCRRESAGRRPAIWTMPSLESQRWSVTPPTAARPTPSVPCSWRRRCGRDKLEVWQNEDARKKVEISMTKLAGNIAVRTCPPQCPAATRPSARRSRLARKRRTRPIAARSCRQRAAIFERQRKAVRYLLEPSGADALPGSFL